jgi:hypothetical protein
VLSVSVKIKNALTATEEIINILNEKPLKDKIVLLRLSGELEEGSNSDIKYQKIENYVNDKEGYILLRNTHALKTKETELEIEFEDTQNIEEEAIK